MNLRMMFIAAVLLLGCLPQVEAQTSAVPVFEKDVLPILKAQPGFKSYSVAIGEGKVFSSSAWDSLAEAESGSAAVASWVAENMTEISLIGDVHYAEVAFSTSLGVTTA